MQFAVSKRDNMFVIELILSTDLGDFFAAALSLFFV